MATCADGDAYDPRYASDRPFLTVDLRQILAALKQRANEADWEIDAVSADEECLWAIGEGNVVQELEALAASGKRIPGATLEALANNVHQVVWGEFRGFDHGAETPWVIVRAINSTFYEVESEDPIVVERIQSAFTDVRVEG